MGDKPLGDLGRTRTPEQRDAYARTIGQGICPFCGPTEDMPPEIRPQMIHVGTHWRAWYNPHPYPGTVPHIILAPIEHWEQPEDISPEAWAEWGELNKRLIRELGLPGGGLVMRFGDHEYKGGSITHLHSHIQVPDRTTYSIATFYMDERLKAFFAGPRKRRKKAA